MKFSITEDIPPTYTELKHHGKERRVRRFGAVKHLRAGGQVIVLRKERYLFIKNEPKTTYLRDGG